jgi:hypothetical protein
MNDSLIFGEPLPMPKLPAWFKGGTETQKRHAYAGRHPMGKRLLTSFPTFGEPTATCGNCGHFKRVRNNSKIYSKCALIPETHGPGTDIRRMWPACELWKEKEVGTEELLK